MHDSINLQVLFCVQSKVLGKEVMYNLVERSNVKILFAYIIAYILLIFNII